MSTSGTQRRVRGRRTLISLRNGHLAVATVYGEWGVIEDEGFIPRRYAVSHVSGRWVAWALRRSHAHALARALAASVPPCPGTDAELRGDMMAAVAINPALAAWSDGVRRVRNAIMAALGLWADQI